MAKKKSAEIKLSSNDWAFITIFGIVAIGSYMAYKKKVKKDEKRLGYKPNYLHTLMTNA